MFYVVLRYLAFGSSAVAAGAEELAPPLAEPELLDGEELAPPLAEPELLDGEELAPPLAEAPLSLFGFSVALVLGLLEDGLELALELGGLLLAPPDAEPAGALDAAELDEDFDGSVAPALPPAAAEPDEEPGAVDGDEGVALLVLEEPGVDEVRSGPLSQAARPKASATETARMENFMSFLHGWDTEIRQQLARPA